MNIQDIITNLENRKDRSTWDKGVTIYALWLLDNVAGNLDLPDSGDIPDITTLKRILLNGATSWDQYSYGGSALIYDSTIAEHLCTPSALKRTDNGRLQPNRSETWLDVQARALSQACNRISRICNGNCPITAGGAV